MHTHSFHHINHIGDFIFSQLESEISNHGSLSIALSGGNTPNALFKYWATNYAKRTDIWYNIYYYWVDERAVSPYDAESNYGTAVSLFFSPLSIPNNHIYRMKGEEKPNLEAKRYENLLQKQLPDVNSVPQLDFIFLGLGDDGHTASIFPGQEHILCTTSELCKESENPYTNQQRITLTSKTINNAKRIFFIILGSHKKRILESVFFHTSNEKKYPAQCIEPKHTEIEIITDIK
ncbi:MAG: 6-phosphogluconolactonase [Bacteroidales bacterium]